MANHADAADAVTDDEHTSAMDADGADADADADAESLDATTEVAVDGSDKAVRRSSTHIAAVVGVISCLMLAALTGWTGMRLWHSHIHNERSELYVQTARQVATNLTTIDYTKVDSDVDRILASATGVFYDDFTQRAQPFIDVVKQAQSSSTGTVTEAGTESEQPEGAQVLVAVVVQSTTAGEPQPPRAWRMRLAVLMVGQEAKVAKVEFVP